MPDRAFTGIALSANAIACASAVHHTIVGTAPEWTSEKWVADENLHVTLRFIGSLVDDRLEVALDALRGSGSRHEPFHLRLADVRAVPDRRRARMIWLVLEDPSGECARLAEDVTDALMPFGVEPEDRPFSPHVTLARARRNRSLAADALAAARSVLGEGKDAERIVSVSAFTLYASTLAPTGPTYEVLASVPLRGVDYERLFV